MCALYSYIMGVLPTGHGWHPLIGIWPPTAWSCCVQCVQQAMLAPTALLALLASGPLRQHKAPRTALNAAQASLHLPLPPVLRTTAHVSLVGCKGHFLRLHAPSLQGAGPMEGTLQYSVHTGDWGVHYSFIQQTSCEGMACEDCPQTGMRCASSHP